MVESAMLSWSRRVEVPLLLLGAVAHNMPKMSIFQIALQPSASGPIDRNWIEYDILKVWWPTMDLFPSVSASLLAIFGHGDDLR